MAVKKMTRSDNTLGAIPQDLVIVGGCETATGAVDHFAFEANDNYEVMDVRLEFSTTSTSGTLTVKKCPAGTAVASGNTIVSSMSLSGTAGTVVAGTLTSTIADRRITSGDRIGFDFGGTVTGLVNLRVFVTLKRILTAGADL